MILLLGLLVGALIATVCLFLGFFFGAATATRKLLAAVGAVKKSQDEEDDY